MAVRQSFLPVMRGTDIPALERLLSALFTRPPSLGRNVFSSATSLRINADQVLFVAGDAGNGCYRVEDGLLKVTMVSRFGNERLRTVIFPALSRGDHERGHTQCERA